MPAINPLEKNIRFLIDANYQRMVSFEQAAFLTSEPSFKQLYLQRAEQSEINIQQLYLMLHANNPLEIKLDTLQNNATLANMFHGKKSTTKILASIKIIEKTIVKWYKTTLKDISGLSDEMTALIQTQYQLLNNAQLQLEHL